MDAAGHLKKCHFKDHGYYVTPVHWTAKQKKIETPV